MEIADVGYKEPALFLASKIATHLYFFLLSDWPIFIDLYLSLQLFVLLLLSLVSAPLLLLCFSVPKIECPRGSSV